MSKAQFNLNLNFSENNSGEVPFITISNSKSNSSKNQNSKTSSNNRISFTHNNNSSSNSRKNLQNSSLIKKTIFLNYHQNQNSSKNLTFTDNSLNNKFCDTSLDLKNHSNISLSEDKKEIETQVKACIDPELATPKKRSDNNAANLINYKYKNKAIQKVDNINGKNLMVYFQYMYVDLVTEEKKKNRNPSVDNISNNTFKLKNKKLNNINKSWNKKNYTLLYLKKQPIKIINKDKSNSKKKKCQKEIKKKRATSNLKLSSLKNFKNLIKLNSFDFENILNKYYNPPKKININNKNMPFMKFQNKNSNNNKNYIINFNNANIEKKMKITPKSDSYKRKLSFSYLKIREGAQKNLFHDNKPKKNEEININQNIYSIPKRLSARVINKKKIYSSNLFDKNINNKNIFIKINPINKDSIKNKNRININKTNNYNDFFKFIDKENNKNVHYQNKGFFKKIKK